MIVFCYAEALCTSQIRLGHRLTTAAAEARMYRGLRGLEFTQRKSKPKPLGLLVLQMESIKREEVRFARYPKDHIPKYIHRVLRRDAGYLRSSPSGSGSGV